MSNPVFQKAMRVIAEKKRKLEYCSSTLIHCEVAQDLLTQTIRELNTDVAIISEQYRNIDSQAWERDSTGRAAVWACGGLPLECRIGECKSGFVWARVAGIYIYSCYAPPNEPMEDFKIFLNRLVRDVEGRKAILKST